LIIFFFLFFGIFINPVFGQTIKLSVIPFLPKETLIESSLPLIDYLNKKTGFQIEFVYIPDYTELLEKFKEGKIDVAGLGPLPYIELLKTYKEVEPIAVVKEKDGSSRYSCVLITSAKGLKRVKDLKGPLALPQNIAHVVISQQI
jgi:phosphonate transport system substrate-binding protein